MRWSAKCQKDRIFKRSETRASSNLAGLVGKLWWLPAANDVFEGNQFEGQNMLPVLDV